jgi:hypothetical protein
VISNKLFCRTFTLLTVLISVCAIGTNSYAEVGEQAAETVDAPNDASVFIDQVNDEMIGPNPAPEDFSVDGAYPRSVREAQAKILWGYINQTGKFVIQPQFDAAERFHRGIARVVKGDFRGHIDRRLKAVIDRKRTEQYRDREYEQYRIEFKKDIFDESGKVLVAPAAQGVTVFRFSDGLAQIILPIDLCRKYFPSAVKTIDIDTQSRASCGFIDTEGRIVIAPRYEMTGPFRKGSALVYKNKAWMLINRQEKILASFKNQDVQQFSEDLALVCDGNDKGFFDRSGKPAFKQRFPDAGSFSDGLAAAAVSASDANKLKLLERTYEWKCGYIDKAGKLVIPASYMAARPFSNGLAPVLINLKWGYIDTSGKVVIKPQFDDAYVFSDGFAAVRQNYLWSYINKTGSFAFATKYGAPGLPNNQRDEIAAKPFKSALTLVDVINDRWRFIDRTGKIRTDIRPGHPQHAESQFRDGLALAKTEPGRKYGFIDINGQLVLEHCHADGPFSEGLAQTVTFGDKTDELRNCGFIDKTGQVVVKPIYFMVHPFRNGFASVSHGRWRESGGYDGKWTFIDKTGREISPFSFDDAKDFTEGFGLVKVGKKWGFINTGGKIVIAPSYDGASQFSDGLAMVRIGKKHGFINHSGKMVIPAKFAAACSFSDGRALVIFPNKRLQYLPSNCEW